MSPQKQTSSTQQPGLIRSLVIGTVLLLTGLALGLKLRAPESDVTHAAEMPSHTQTSAQRHHTDSAAESTANITVARPLFDIQDDGNTEAVNETAIHPNDDNAHMNETDPAILARRQEMQYLQEVLPGNNMIPHDKSPQQLDALWDEFKRYHTLQQHIDAGDATDAEKEAYYAIRMAKYEEEKALIALCRDVAANTLASADEKQALLCQHMTKSSAERLQVIEDSIAKLEQDLWVSAHTE